MNRIKHLLLFAAAIMVFALFCATPAFADASTPILVTMGDSFACGEGLEPYYGQSDAHKYWNQEWVAHRSTRSWNSRLVVGGYAATSLKATALSPSYDQVKDQDTVTFSNYSWSNGTWFNLTNSGATITNVYGGTGGYSAAQEKYLSINDAQQGTIAYTAVYGPQIEAIDYINKTYGNNSVDYIVVNVGANDLNIGSIFITAGINEVINGQPLDTSLGMAGITLQIASATPFGTITQDMDTLNSQINTAKTNFYLPTSEYGSVRQRYINMVNKLRETAGSQANIILVGYPVFFSGTQPTVFYSQEEMDTLDNYLRWLDNEMKSLVNQFKANGYTNLYYVSLVDLFEGHGANTAQSYCEGIVTSLGSESLRNDDLVSLSSFHPNERGSQAIANAVQEVINSIERHASGWAYEGGAWRYYDNNGNMITNNFVADGGYWYYFGANGAMVANSWVNHNGYSYYIGASGAMVTNNWVTYNGHTYYFGADGIMVSNTWIKYNGAYYYLGADGAMVVNNWVKYNGRYYYTDASGAAVVNTWVKYNGAYYYIGPKGTPIVNGWVKYNGAYYYLGSNGKAVANRWVKYNGNYYYVGANGKAVGNTWVAYKGREYYINAKGVATGASRAA